MKISSHRISIKEKSRLLHQLAALISANIPLALCLHLLAKSQTNPAIKKPLQSIHKELSQGRELSKCAASYPDLFPTLTTCFIEFGEKTGTLEKCITKASHLQQAFLHRSLQIKKALFYPCFLLFTSLLIIIVLLTLVVPRFQAIFTQLNTTLPESTRHLFATSEFIRHHGLTWGISVIFLLILSRYHATRYQPLKLIVRLPYLRQIEFNMNLALFLTQLHVAFASGIPLLQALKLTENHLSASFKPIVTRLILTTQAGYPLHTTLSAHARFPSFILEMIEIGEKSGQLEKLLEQAAHMVGDDLNHQIDQLVQLAEPLIMLILGVLIGGLVIVLYLPTFSLGSAFQ